MPHVETIVTVLLVIGLGVSGCASGGQTDSDEVPTAQPGAAKDAKGKAAKKSGGPKRPEGFRDAEVVEVLSTVGGHAVLLGQTGGDKLVPIFIGESQAMAIKLRLERRRYSRPLTHDLLDKAVEELGGEVVKVHIGAIKSGVFVGTVFIEGPKKTHELDARSSDAIALAVGNEVPIFVAREVFEKAGLSREKFEDRGLERRRRPESPGEEEPSEEGDDSPDKSPFY